MTLPETIAASVLAGNNVSEVVDFAIESNRSAKHFAAEVDQTKPFFREVASARAALSGEKAVVLEGILGAVQIVFPGLVVQAKVLGKDKRADLLQLDGQLPPEIFASLFRKKIVIEFADAAEDYQAKLAKLTPAQQNLLGNYVEVVESTPRVNIAK